MAKSSSGSRNPSRIRFVMVEAELGDGDISQITQAITNALRPPVANATPRRIVVSPPQLNGNSDPDMEIVDAEAEEVEVASMKSASQKPKSQRRVAPKPNILELDVLSDPPLASLGKLKSNHKRYLAIAKWLHDHRNLPVITVDHIYTCFRHLEWPINIADFAQPLRELKFKQFFTQPETAKYAINQLGLAKAAEAGE
jgi:hypothetical protein